MQLSQLIEPNVPGWGPIRITFGVCGDVESSIAGLEDYFFCEDL